MHHIAVQCRRLPIVGQQCDLSGLLAVLVKCLDRPAPRSTLAVTDLAQIQHVSLHHAPARHPAVFHDAPVAVLLAVLPSFRRTLWRKNMATGFQSLRPFRKRPGRHRTRFSLFLVR
jgi:hypothetical protein